MADNTTLNLGSGGDVIASDDVSGVKYQVVKLAVGADGAAALVANANPIPIADAGGSLTVDGTVAVSSLAAGTNNIGDVDVLTIAAGDNNIGNVDIVTVPADPFGANADAASATGSISAKLRFIAATGIPITGTVTVGSHAVTNAGTFAVQSAAAGVAAENAAVSGNPVLIGGRYDSSARTLGNGDVGGLALNASGHALVEISAGAGSGGTSAADDADFVDGTTSGTPVMGVFEGTPTTVTDGDLGVVGITVNRELKVSVSSYAGSKLDDAAYTAGTDIVAAVGGIVTADSVDSGDVGAFAMTTARALHTAVQSIAAGDNNIGNVDIASAIPAGNNNIGDVDVASIAAGTNLIGNVGVGVRTTGGATAFLSIDLDESEEEVKASAGQVYFIHAMNLASATRYLKFYNDTAANVTVGTTTPVLVFALPADVAGFTLAIPNGIAFSAGITVAATTGFAHADNGAPGANEIIVNLGYA